MRLGRRQQAPPLPDYARKCKWCRHRAAVVGKERAPVITIRRRITDVRIAGDVQEHLRGDCLDESGQSVSSEGNPLILLQVYAKVYLANLSGLHPYPFS